MYVCSRCNVLYPDIYFLRDYYNVVVEGLAAFSPAERKLENNFLMEITYEEKKVMFSLGADLVGMCHKVDGQRGAQ